MPVKNLYELIRIVNWKELRIYKVLASFNGEKKDYYGLSCSFKILESHEWFEIENIETCRPRKISPVQLGGYNDSNDETYLYWFLADGVVSIVITEMHEKLLNSFYQYEKADKKGVIELFNSSGSGKTIAMLYCIIRLLAKKEGIHLCNRDSTVTYYWYDEREKCLLLMKNNQAYKLTDKLSDEMALTKSLNTRETLQNYIHVTVDAEYKPISKFAFNDFNNVKVSSLTDLLVLSNTYIIKETVWFWPYQSKTTIGLVRCLFENYYKNEKLSLKLNSIINSNFCEKVSADTLFEVCGPDLNLANTCTNIESYSWMIHAYLDLFQDVFGFNSSLTFSNQLSVSEGIQAFLDELMLYETACQAHRQIKALSEKRNKQCYSSYENCNCSFFDENTCGEIDFIKLPVLEYSTVSRKTFNCTDAIKYSLGDNYISSMNKLIPSRIIFKVLLNKLIVNQTYKYLLKSSNTAGRRLGFAALVIRNLKVHKLKLFPTVTVFDFPVFLTAVNDCQFLKILVYWRTGGAIEPTQKESESRFVRASVNKSTLKNDFSENISFIDTRSQDIAVVFFSVKETYNIIMLPSRMTLAKLKENLSDVVTEGIVLVNITNESSDSNDGMGLDAINPKVVMPDIIVEAREVSRVLLNSQILKKNAKELSSARKLPFSLAAQCVFVDYHSSMDHAAYRYVTKKRDLFCCCARSANNCERIF